MTQNIGRGLTVTGYSRTLGGRRSFQDGELKTLFESDLFLRPDRLLDRRTATSDVTLYWLFVLGCTSGARLEEVGQARLADVKTDAGVLHIDVDDIDAGPAGGTADASLPEKSVKTDGSRRLVPIHDHALALGFERYVAALRQLGQELLFPDLRPNRCGKLTQDASRRANRYINKVVDEDARLVFHSLRHRFKDEGRDADVQERVLDQLCGHAPATVGGRYGRGGAVKTLKRSLDKLRFDCVDWARLASAAAHVDWLVVVREVASRAGERRAAGGKGAPWK